MPHKRIFSRIIGTGSALPARRVSNDELAKTVATSDEWIKSRSGIRARYVADDTIQTSDLATRAARNALSAAEKSVSDIDLIIVATTTPDCIFPSTACIVQEKLGAKSAAAFDVQAVCSGFIYALHMADKMISAGAHRNVLVIGAEIFTRILDWNDRGTCVLFGDGAGAVLLHADSRPGILATEIKADGSKRPLLEVPGQIQSGKIVGHPFVTMDGQGVFKFAVEKMAQTCESLLQQFEEDEQRIDWLIPHQANIRIMDATARRLGVPSDNVIVTVDQHGNTSAASIPLALDVGVRDGRVREGDRVMMVGVGGGFTWGSVYVEM